MAVTVTTDPSRIVAENDALESLVSMWVAVHNPIVYEMQRSDFLLDSTIVVTGTGTIGTFDADVTLPDNKFDTLVAGQYIYLFCTDFAGLFLVTNVTSNTVTIEMDGTIADDTYDELGAYINLVQLPGYYVEVKIYSDTDGVETLIASAKFQPFNNGTFIIDPSAWLQKLAIIVDEFDYIDDSWRDLALAGGFAMKYRERFDAEDSEDLPAFADPGTFYWVNAAMQVGDLFGQNMGEYATFNAAPPEYPAKFLTLFTNPIYYPGFPFDIAFIRSQDMDGIDLSFLLTNHDVNGTTIGLAVLEDIVEETGVIRLLPIPTGSPYSMKITVTDETGEDAFTEQKTITISKDCPDYPVYLKWINTLGGWSYWLFAFDQQKSINVGDAVTFEKHYTELSTADNKLQYLSKRAFPKIVCGANAVSLANLAGLKGLLYSPVVMMLTNPDTWETDGEGDTALPKWQTVLVQPGSFNLETTRSGIADVEITLQLSEVNVQTQ